MLPKHGKINCQECFEKNELICQPHFKWRLRNDPGAWGSSEPETLVLGFSKGSTQADIYSTGKFEDVAFGGQARNRLDRILKSVNLLPNNSHVSDLIESPSKKLMAFGSLVRCSLSRQDDSSGNWLTSGNLILKSFNEVPDILSRCSKKYVANLPEKTKTIVLLGVTEAYIKQCHQLLKTLYPDLQWVNQVAYRSEDRLFVHLTHPSPGNGTYQAWIDGAPKQQLAIEALSERILKSEHIQTCLDHKTSLENGESKILEKVLKITAIGTRGDAKGKVFSAKIDSRGRYVLNEKTVSPTEGNRTNLAANKIYVTDLDEAANLLKTDDYLINLVSADGKRALRELKKVNIEYA